MDLLSPKVKPLNMDLLSAVEPKVKPRATKARRKAAMDVLTMTPTTAVAVRKEPTSLLQVIADAARDPNVDVGKMRDLITMVHGEEDRQRKNQFNEALVEMGKEVPVIVKDAKADRNIAYARLETVSKILNPLMLKHGFQLSFSMVDSPNVDNYRIKGILSHRAGHTRDDYFVDIPTSTTGAKGAAIMNRTQSAGAAISYGRRYLKLMVFDITIAGEDTDGNIPQTKCTADEMKALKQAIKFADVDEEKFCGYFGIESVDDLLKSRFAEAMRLLKDKRGEK